MIRPGINVDLTRAQKGNGQPDSKKSSPFLDFLNKDLDIFSTPFGDKKKEKLYSDIFILFSSGLDIKTTLELIVSEETNKSTKALVEEIKKDLIKGSSLSEAIAKTGRFTDYEIYSIKIGEETGNLQAVLSDLNVFFAKKIKQNRQVISALSYPVVVLATVVGVLVFMMKFMVPMFSEMFKRFKGDLPAITKLVISTSNFIGNTFYIFFVGILICFFLLYFNRQKEWFRKLNSELLLNTPVIGSLTQKIYLGRFCHSMTLLLSAQIPLVNALDIIKKMIKFYPIEVSIDIISKDITGGNTFWESLKKHSIYTNRMISLIKVGEEVNQLDILFKKLNSQFNDEIEHQTTVLKTLLEPILILFLGLIVGLILVAMYLPIFQMSTGIAN